MQNRRLQRHPLTRTIRGQTLALMAEHLFHRLNRGINIEQGRNLVLVEQ
jgi:hypothetical protein